MRKRVLSCILVSGLAVMLLFAGCGKDQSGTAEGSAAADEGTAGAVSMSGDADSSAESETEGDASGTTDGTAITGSIEDVHESETKTLTITATGDCTLGVTQDQSYDGSFNAYYDSYGEDYFFNGVRDIFEADDMTIINLECVLSTATERVEKTFNLKGSPEYVGIMTGSSVEACSMGNNHTYDYGEEGFQETKSVLEEAGIAYAYSEQSGMYTTEDGVKVGIVSASLLSQSEEKLENMQSQIAELREEGAEVVIACCHWGIEKDYYPNDYQQTTAHTLIDAGADLIIGNHPHVLQGVEVYEGKVICYSLGNFCFGGNKNPSDKNTMIYQQTFTIVDGEVQTDAIDAEIIPCRLSTASSYNDYQPTVASGDTKQNIISLVNEYSSALGSVSFDSEGNLLE
ncbi:MAG: CapA family protein [Lachnospiraceae bacterium]|nr:CapA family protein [Lachnospiraceae bacterium]